MTLYRYRAKPGHVLVESDKKLWDVELFARDIGFFKLYDILADDAAGAVMTALANLAEDERDSDGIGPYATRRDKLSTWAGLELPGVNRFRSLWHLYTRREHHGEISPGVDV